MKKRSISTIDAFSSVALWQLMSFIMLLCFIWVNEFFDLSHIIFDTERSPFNFYRVSLLSSGVITAAIVTIGHTYEKQRKVINKIVTACLYCHRVQNKNGSWEHVVEYFMKNFPVNLERGTCPDCKKMLQTIDMKE